MKNRKKLTTMLVTALAISAIASGCGGAPKPESIENAKDKVQNAADKVKDSAKSNDTTEASKLLQEFVADQEKATYQVAYDISTSQDEQTMDGAYVQFFQKPNMRMDMNVTVQGQSVSSSLYQLDDKTYSCSSSEGVINCLDLTQAKVPGQTEEKANEAMTAADEIKAKIDKIDAVVGESQTIAGEKTTCLEYTVEGEESKNTLCYTSDGIPLKIESVSTGTTKMTLSMVATKFSRDIPSDAFKLPAEPTKMPVMPNGQTMPQGMQEGMPEGMPQGMPSN